MKYDEPFFLFSFSTTGAIVILAKFNTIQFENEINGKMDFFSFLSVLLRSIEMNFYTFTATATLWVTIYNNVKLYSIKWYLLGKKYCTHFILCVIEKNK